MSVLVTLSVVKLIVVLPVENCRQMCCNNQCCTPVKLVKLCVPSRSPRALLLYCLQYQYDAKIQINSISNVIFY